MQPDTTPSFIDADALSREELIAMAREADPFGDDGRLVSLAMLTPGTLERFAALVAAREREACAQVCRSEMARALYNLDNDLGINRNFWNGGSEIAASCAASITARGTTKFSRDAKRHRLQRVVRTQHKEPHAD